MVLAIKEVNMRYAKRAILFTFAILMFGGGLALDASAQGRRGNSVSRGTRPIIVRRIIRPHWGLRRHYWGYNSFYDPYWRSPYMRYQEQKYYLERELRGNERELREHQEKYRADGQVTAKEQRELEDDYKDVREARAKLSRFNRNN